MDMDKDNIKERRIAFCMKIRAIRNKRGVSADQLAALTGIRRENILRIEKGTFSTGVDTLIKIADALGHKVDFVE
jgi:transcriptional regulator with XRE-family HTH domain